MTCEVYNEWKRWSGFGLEDPDLTEELERLKDEKELADRFYKALEFGTGGLRGRMGVGTNRLNCYTVARATQGYVEYLHGLGGRRVAVAYDSRHKSEYFAKVAAQVLAAGGIQVHIFPELTPTPLLSFAIRYLGCDGGIVITASHNPAEYNGYKIYGKDGGQITNSAASAIWNKICGVDVLSGGRRMPLEQARAKGLVVSIGTDVTEAYLEAVSAQALGLRQGNKSSLSVVYSPLNGTGLGWVTKALRRSGYSRITVVEEQREPDGNFPTCPVPNPETAQAMELAVRCAEREGADLALATDPDCDRVGVAVRSRAKAPNIRHSYRLLSGNEVGVLLLYYICSRRLETGTMPDRPIAAKTIVTTELARRIAEDFGVGMVDVLTGFKYIGEQIGRMEQKGELERFLMGIEESYGYLAGTYVRDKDGVNASLLICDMAAYYKERGRALTDVLEEIYNRYGYYLNRQRTYQLEGAEGTAQMRRIMEVTRRYMGSLPECMGRRMVRFSDYLASVALTMGNGEEKLMLPQSDVCKMEWEGGLSAVVRPSGTEPKLKVYLEARGKDGGEAQEKLEKLEKMVEECCINVRNF